MKKFIPVKLLLLAIITLGFASCRQPVTPGEGSLNKEFTMRVGESVSFSGEDLKITFISVPEDSRCPERATCIWEGNAKAVFSIGAINRRVAAQQFTLNTANGEIYPHKAQYLGYELEMIRLDPRPMGSAPIPQEKYVAHLVVRKL